MQTPYPRVEQQWLAAQWRRLEAERAARAAAARGGSPDSPTAAAGDAAAPQNAQLALLTERFGVPGSERLSEAGAKVQAGAGKAKSFLRAGMKKGVAAVRARIGVADDEHADVRHPPRPPESLHNKRLQILHTVTAVHGGRHLCPSALYSSRCISKRRSSCDAASLYTCCTTMSTRGRSTSRTDVASTAAACMRVQAVVDPQAVSSFIGWHRVVIQRATTLLPAVAAAMHISAFFHKKVPDLPPCCLLDQVVTHTLAGISSASRRSLAALKAPLTVADAATAPDAADAFMSSGPYEVLRAVAATGEIVDAVQRHFQSTVQPRLLVVCCVLCAVSNAVLTTPPARRSCTCAQRLRAPGLPGCGSVTHIGARMHPHQHGVRSWQDHSACGGGRLGHG